MATSQSQASDWLKWRPVRSDAWDLRLVSMLSFITLGTVNPLLHRNSHLHCVGEQCRSRSAGISVPSDQDLKCSLLDSLGYFWQRCSQCRSRSDCMDVPADLDLHWSYMNYNTYIWIKGLMCKKHIFSSSLCSFYNLYQLVLKQELLHDHVS
jgi:hypothetical protein